MTKNSDQMVEAIANVVEHLVPGAKVSISVADPPPSHKAVGYSRRGTHGATGAFSEQGTLGFWFDLPHKHRCTLRVSRNPVPITAHEKSILGHIPVALEGLLIEASRRGIELGQRIAGRMSFATILLARFLRKSNAPTFWTPALILSELQQLTFARYEGTMCTSGFVYSSQPQQYLPRIPSELYVLHHFDPKPLIGTGHFSSPASYRYVDGHNTFYLVDNLQQIHGVIAARNPGKFGPIERSSGLHILPLVTQMPGRAWAAYVGRNTDVCVVTSRLVVLRWSGNYWHVRDRTILLSALTGIGCEQDIAEQITSVCYALSDLRHGTVILVPDCDTVLPKTVGSIDNSGLNQALHLTFRSASLKSLLESRQIIGLLSSDGLTTISKRGQILATGQIIDLANTLGASPGGGGRTHAAKAASTCGLAIKVSEDGPITLFRNGEKLISIQ